jgi:hypothetical protein
MRHKERIFWEMSWQDILERDTLVSQGLKPTFDDDDDDFEN